MSALSEPVPGPACRVTAGSCDPSDVERILRLLPDWFGIESSLLEYAAAARDHQAYLAWLDDPAEAGTSARPPAGVLLAARHFPCSAEIYLIAVEPGAHRRGLGRTMVQALEADLAADGAEFLAVKTLGPSHPDEGYARTREFYAGLGFRPLEELHGLWPGNPCLILVKPLRRTVGTWR